MQCVLRVTRWRCIEDSFNTSTTMLLLWVLDFKGTNISLKGRRPTCVQAVVNTFFSCISSTIDAQSLLIASTTFVDYAHIQLRHHQYSKRRRSSGSTNAPLRGKTLTRKQDGTVILISKLVLGIHVNPTWTAFTRQYLSKGTSAETAILTSVLTVLCIIIRVSQRTLKLLVTRMIDSCQVKMTVVVITIKIKIMTMMMI